MFSVTSSSCLSWPTTSPILPLLLSKILLKGQRLTPLFSHPHSSFTLNFCLFQRPNLTCYFLFSVNVSLPNFRTVNILPKLPTKGKEIKSGHPPQPGLPEAPERPKSISRAQKVVPRHSKDRGTPRAPTFSKDDDNLLESELIPKGVHTKLRSLKVCDLFTMYSPFVGGWNPLHYSFVLTKVDWRKIPDTYSFMSHFTLSFVHEVTSL